jgi:hypothetical protein
MCKSDPAESPLDALLVAIKEYVETTGRELTAAQLGEHLIRLRHGIDLLEVDFAICAAIFATTDEYEAEGSVSPVDWIRHNCHMSRQAAGRAVTAGEQAGRLPASVRALDAGEIGFGHFSLLAGVARALAAKPLVASGDGLDGAGGNDGALGEAGGTGGDDGASPTDAASADPPTRRRRV